MRALVGRASSAALVVVVSFSITSCGGSTTPPPDGGIDASEHDAGAVDAFVPSSALIVASAGGSVRSPDGVFTLIVPPAALAADTPISISIVPRAAWSDEVRATGPVGEVYDVQPDGLVFLVPAYGVHSFTTLPAELVAGTGEYAFATHRSQSVGGSIDSARTELVVRGAGGFVIGTLAHLSQQWFTSTLPSGARVTAHLAADTGDHAVGTQWLASDVTLYTSSGSTAGLSYSAAATVFGPVGQPQYVAPLAPPGWTAEAMMDVLAYRGDPESGEALHFESLTYSAGRSPASTTPLTVGVSHEASMPAPGWRCLAVTGAPPDDLELGVTLREGTSNEVSVRLQVGTANCVAAAVAPTGEVFAADNTRLTLAGAALVAGAVGALANVISETPAVATHCRPLGGSTTARVCTNVPSFDSVAGASPITLRSSRQTGTATFAGSRYGIAGLTGSAVFAAADTLHVSGTPIGATTPTTIDVPAPAPLPAASAFITPGAGMRSPVRIADGTPGNFYVSIGLTGPGGGTSFLTRSVPIADAPLSGTDRLIQLLEDEMIDDLAALFLEPTDVYVGVVAERVDTELFSGIPTAIRAGRFYQVSAADLGPTSAGGTDADCFTGLPLTIGGAGTVVGTDAVVATMCRGGTACRLVAGTACPPGTSSFARFGWDVATSAPFVSGERIDLATHGLMPMRGELRAIPRDVDVRTEVGGGSEGYEIDYRVEGTGFAFGRISAGVALPPLAATCDTLPASWLVHLGSTTGTTSAGRVCSNSAGTSCGVASPGATCVAPTSTFDIRFTAAGVPELAAVSPWTFATTTHGTLAPDLVSNLPRGTDVTIESLRSTGLHATTVLRIDGTNVQLLSATLTP